jgi:hypothetical protein
MRGIHIRNTDRRSRERWGMQMASRGFCPARGIFSDFVFSLSIIINGLFFEDPITVKTSQSDRLNKCYVMRVVSQDGRHTSTPRR